MAHPPSGNEAIERNLPSFPLSPPPPITLHSAISRSVRPSPPLKYPTTTHTHTPILQNTQPLHVGSLESLEIISTKSLLRIHSGSLGFLLMLEVTKQLHNTSFISSIFSLGRTTPQTDLPGQCSGFLSQKTVETGSSVHPPYHISRILALYFPDSSNFVCRHLRRALKSSSSTCFPNKSPRPPGR